MVLETLCNSLTTSSLTGNIRDSCLQHFWRKVLIFSIVFLVTWTFTKVPYFIGFDANGDTDYEKGGLTAQINLVHWIEGYTGPKLKAPACNFFLIHVALASTVLIMMTLTLIKTAWRKKYGYYFFTFAILLGVHSLPASWKMGDASLKFLFTFVCVGVITISLFGYRTLQFYDTDPAKYGRHLLIEYSLVTLAAYGAGIIEVVIILPNFIYKASHGAFKEFPDNPLVGHTVYDLVPESVGMTIFFAWAAVFWFWWPIKLLEIDTTNISTSESADDLLEIDTDIDANGTMAEPLL